MKSSVKNRGGVILGVCAAVSMSAAALGQDLGVKAPPQGGMIVIENATIHPVSGPDIASGHIVFDQGRITKIGAGRYSGAGAKPSVIDAKGKHVYPGLIAANTLMGLMEIGSVRATLDYSEVGNVSPEVRAAVAVNPDSTVIPVTRANGILTCGVMPLGGPIPGRASVMRMDGWTWEDMTVEDDAGLMVNWPNLRPVRGFFAAQRTDEEQAEEMRKNLEAIEQAFGAATAYLKARAADPRVATDVRWEAMRGAIEGGEPVFIRADELEQIQSAISWATSRGLKPIIVGGRDAGSAIDMLKRHSIPVIVGGTHRLPNKVDGDYDELFALPALLEKEGIKWCLASSGSGRDTPHERNLPYQAATAVAYGLSPEAALRSITLSAAELLGVADALGSLDQGKSATLIVTDGNPLEVTTKIERAFIDGREIDLSNKHTVLDAKYREKYRQLKESPKQTTGTNGSGAQGN